MDVNANALIHPTEMHLVGLSVPVQSVVSYKVCQTDKKKKEVQDMEFICEDCLQQNTTVTVTHYSSLPLHNIFNYVFTTHLIYCQLNI